MVRPVERIDGEAEFDSEEEFRLVGHRRKRNPWAKYLKPQKPNDAAKPPSAAKPSQQSRALSSTTFNTSSSAVILTQEDICSEHTVQKNRDEPISGGSPFAIGSDNNEDTTHSLDPEDASVHTSTAEPAAEALNLVENVPTTNTEVKAESSSSDGNAKAKLKKGKKTPAASSRKGKRGLDDTTGAEVEKRRKREKE